LSDRTISTESLGELSGQTFASLQRVCDDLRSVCDSVEDLDPSLISFEKSVRFHHRASMLRAQATHALAAVSALSSAAASYELLAHFVDHSLQLVPQAAPPPAAKVKTKARSRKR
jgi:hypothetical protein